MPRKYEKGRKGTVPIFKSPEPLEAKIKEYFTMCLSGNVEQWTRDKNGKPYKAQSFVGPNMEGVALYCGFYSLAAFERLGQKPAFKVIIQYAKDEVKRVYQQLCDSGAILPLIAKQRLGHMGIVSTEKLQLSGTLTVNWKQESDKAVKEAHKALAKLKPKT